MFKTTIVSLKFVSQISKNNFAKILKQKAHFQKINERRVSKVNLIMPLDVVEGQRNSFLILLLSQLDNFYFKKGFVNIGLV